MNDIGKELYERVRADFERRLKSDKRPPKDMRGVSDYSARVGRYLAEAIAANVTEDALPDRRLYYNIAESILEPSLRTNYELVNDTAAEVQRLLDERQGLHIKPARADYPAERVHAVIGAASEEGIDFDRALRRMTSPAENITQSFADDFMQANAEQRSKAGFDTFIERQGGLNCCPWCAGLVGVFAYPKGLPKEVFARHDNCTCSVTYGTKGGARQNVWSKQTWSSAQEREYLRLRDEEKKKAGGKRLTEKQVAAIIAKVGSQPHKLTYKEALARGGFAQPKRLTTTQKHGIIESGRVRRLTISTIDSPIERQHTGKGNPNAILTFGIELNDRQKKLLELLPNFDSRRVVPKKSVNMADLSALTAYTGHEFAMFTKGGERLIIRGGVKNVNINPEDARKLAADGYRWSGHTHPGIDFLCMQPSDGDYAILACFKQINSVIYNSKGDFRTFERRE